MQFAPQWAGVPTGVVSHLMFNVPIMGSEYTMTLIRIKQLLKSLELQYKIKHIYRKNVKFRLHTFFPLKQNNTLDQMETQGGMVAQWVAFPPDRVHGSILSVGDFLCRVCHFLRNKKASLYEQRQHVSFIHHFLF